MPQLGSVVDADFLLKASWTAFRRGRHDDRLLACDPRLRGRRRGAPGRRRARAGLYGLLCLVALAVVGGGTALGVIAMGKK